MLRNYVALFTAK